MAENAWVDDHGCSGGQARGRRRADDTADELVAQSHGDVLLGQRMRARGERARHGAVEVFVQVAAADATPFYGDEGLVVCGFWGRDVEDADVIWAVVLCCFHGRCGVC